MALRGSHYISARLASQKAEPLAQDAVGLEAPVHAGRGGWLLIVFAQAGSCATGCAVSALAKECAGSG